MNLDVIVAKVTQSPVVAVDTETTGLTRSDKLVGISLAWLEGDGIETAYLPVAHPPSLFSTNLDADTLVPLMRLLIMDKRLLFHNALFDIGFLDDVFEKQVGSFISSRFMDTKILARLVGADVRAGAKNHADKADASLLGLYSYLVGVTPDQREWISRMKSLRSTLHTLPAEMVAEYAEMDARMTLAIFRVLSRGWVYPRVSDLWDTEREFLRLLYRMERRGILLDKEYTNGTLNKLNSQIVDIEERLRRRGLAPETLRSPKALASWLIAHGVPLESRTEAGHIRTSIDELQKYRGEIVDLILEWRHLSKAVSSWLNPFLELVDSDGRIRARFDGGGTVSGRISCSLPNLQAVPVSSRGLPYGSLSGIFTTPLGFRLLSFDYKQADLRVATAYAREETMAKVLASGDPYSELAREVWGDPVTSERRQMAKRISLATINAVGKVTLAKSAGISISDAEDILMRHRNTFPKFPETATAFERFAEANSYVVLWTGRRLFLEDDFHKAFSRVVQGGVAEMVKLAMLAIDDLLRGTESAIILQVHDSVVIELSDRDTEVVPVIVSVLESALPKGLTHRTDPPVRMRVESGVWMEKV